MRLPMKNEWMLDVLADLQRFADLNGMPRLSEELSHVAEVAREELEHPLYTIKRVPRDEGSCRTVSGPVVAG